MVLVSLTRQLPPERPIGGRMQKLIIGLLLLHLRTSLAPK